MAVRELALKALKCFKEGQYFKNLAEFRNREYHALVGAFTGIANGQISLGQGWIGELLLSHQLDQDAEGFQQYEMSADEGKLLEAVFASGICCQGQPLGKERLASR